MRYHPRDVGDPCRMVGYQQEHDADEQGYQQEHGDDDGTWW